MRKWWNKFRESKYYFITASILYIIGGLLWLIRPEPLPVILIQILGVILIFEGITYALKARLKHLEDELDL